MENWLAGSATGTICFCGNNSNVRTLRACGKFEIDLIYPDFLYSATLLRL